MDFFFFVMFWVQNYFLIILSMKIPERRGVIIRLAFLQNFFSMQFDLIDAFA